MLKALFQNTVQTAEIDESYIAQATFSRRFSLLHIICVAVLLLTAGIYTVSGMNAFFLLLCAVVCIWSLPYRLARVVKDFRSQKSLTVLFYDKYFTIGSGGRQYPYSELRKVSLCEDLLMLHGKGWTAILAKDGFSETTCEDFCSFLKDKNIEILQEKLRRSRQMLRSVIATVFCVLLALLNALTLNLNEGDPAYLYIGSTDTDSLFAVYEYNHPELAQSHLSFSLMCKNETMTVGSVSVISGDEPCAELYGTFLADEQWHAMPLSRCVLKTVPIDAERSVVSYRLGDSILLFLNGLSGSEVLDSQGERPDNAERFFSITGYEGCFLLLTDVSEDYVLYVAGTPLSVETLGIAE